jgi:hypothetical protein
LPPREEEKCALGTQKKCYADQEEDVAHCEKGAVKEEDDAEDEEEDTYIYILAMRDMGNKMECSHLPPLEKATPTSVQYRLACLHWIQVIVLVAYSASRRAST